MRLDFENPVKIRQLTHRPHASEFALMREELLFGGEGGNYSLIIRGNLEFRLVFLPGKNLHEPA